MYEGPLAVADSALALEAGGVSNGTAGTNPSGNVLSNDTDVVLAIRRQSLVLSQVPKQLHRSDVGYNVVGQYGALNINANGGYTSSLTIAMLLSRRLRNSGKHVDRCLYLHHG